MQMSLLFYSPCTLYGKLQNLCLKCVSSVLRASPHCKHTVGAFQPGILALALFHAALLIVQETSSRQILDASGSVVQRGLYMPLVLIQPQLVGDGNVGA